MKVHSGPLLEGAGVLINTVAILALAVEIIGLALLCAFWSHAPDLLFAGSVIYIAVFGIAVRKAVLKRRGASLDGNAQT